MNNTQADEQLRQAMPAIGRARAASYLLRDTLTKEEIKKLLKPEPNKPR